MRKQAVRIGIVAAAAAGALAVAGTGSAAVSSTPSKGTADELRDCAAAAAAEGWSGTWTGIKVDQPVAAGTYGSVMISNRAGNQFDWSSTTPVQVVFVKAGPGANLYVYDGGATGDTGLQSPMPDSISHALFCFRAGDPAPTGGGSTDSSTGGSTGASIGDPTDGSTGGSTGSSTIVSTDSSTGASTSTSTSTSTSGASDPAPGSPAVVAAASATATAPVTLAGAFKPPVAKRRPVVKSRKLSLRFCARIVVSQKSLVAGARGRVSLKVTAGGLAAPGLRLRISGAGVDRIVRTGNGGNVSVNVIPAKAGILRITSLGRRGCNTARIGAVGSFEPPVTG